MTEAELSQVIATAIVDLDTAELALENAGTEPDDLASIAASLRAIAGCALVATRLAVFVAKAANEADR